jgi:hypothetical protein
VDHRQLSYDPKTSAWKVPRLLGAVTRVLRETRGSGPLMVLLLASQATPLAAWTTYSWGYACTQ